MVVLATYNQTLARGIHLSIAAETLVRRIFVKSGPVQLYSNTGQDYICQRLSWILLYTYTKTLVRREFVKGCPVYLST